MKLHLPALNQYLDNEFDHNDKYSKMLVESIMGKYEPTCHESQMSANDSNIDDSSINNLTMVRIKNSEIDEEVKE